MDATFPVFARPRAASDRPIAAVRLPASHPGPAPVLQPASGGYSQRRSPIAIAFVVAAHVVALWALVHFDVIAITRARPQALAVTMVALAPPPPRHETARPVTPPKVTTPLVAPPPLVALPAPPPPVAVAPPPPVATAAPDPAPTPTVASPAPAAPGPAPVNLMAEVLDAPPPRFPAESRRLRESGTVRLRVTVSAEGRVSTVEVARSSGFDRLDRAAIDAVRRWRFRARIADGVAAEVIGFVPVTFNPPH